MDTTQDTGESVLRNEQIQLDKRAINALLRKIDLRLMPVLILLFFFSFLGPLNIGIKEFQFKLCICFFLRRTCGSS